jgi:hypothetical protein
MESETDVKVNAAVVALKKDINSLLDKVMKENFELSERLKALEEKVSSHQDKLWEYCPHTTI